jgi:hypothetical protein
LAAGIARATGREPGAAPDPKTLATLARRRPFRQVGDLLDEVDIAHHHAGLGIVVKFAGVIEDANIPVTLSFVSSSLARPT